MSELIGEAPAVDPRSLGRRVAGAWARIRWYDVMLAAALTVLGLAVLPYVDKSSSADQDVDLLAAALVVVVGTATAARAAWPVAAVITVGVGTAVYLALGYPYGPIMFCLALTVYSVARHRPLVVAGGWSGVVYLAMLVHLFTNDAALSGMAGLAPAAAWVVIPLTVGAARRLVGEAHSRERAVADQRLVDEERLRLAQEVHDVVGHGLAAIQMQADIALHVQDTRPEQARSSLEAISRASAEALEELRATLAVITPGRSTAHRAPTPGLARLDSLRQRVEDAGVAVDLTVEGDPTPLPSALDVVAYRVLQESLTNVVKHSAQARAEVRIRYRPDEVVLTVTNEDLTADAHSDGFGITGMRRRVRQAGGRLEAGPGRRTGTFEVEARLPVPGGDAR